MSSEVLSFQKLFSLFLISLRLSLKKNLDCHFFVLEYV